MKDSSEVKWTAASGVGPSRRPKLSVACDLHHSELCRNHEGTVCTRNTPADKQRDLEVRQTALETAQASLKSSIPQFNFT